MYEFLTFKVDTVVLNELMEQTEMVDVRRNCVKLSSDLMRKQTNVRTELQDRSPLKHRGWKYFTDSEEAMVEVPSAGAGGRGSQLRRG